MKKAAAAKHSVIMTSRITSDVFRDNDKPNNRDAVP